MMKKLAFMLLDFLADYGKLTFGLLTLVAFILCVYYLIIGLLIWSWNMIPLIIISLSFWNVSNSLDAFRKGKVKWDDE